MKWTLAVATCALVLGLSACGSGDVQTDNVFDPNSANNEELLIFSVKDGDTGTVKQFLREAPGIAQERDISGNTMLHHAAVFSQVQVAELLIENGADVNARNTDGMTPLAAAEDRRASDEMLDFLRKNGGQE